MAFTGAKRALFSSAFYIMHCQISHFVQFLHGDLPIAHAIAAKTGLALLAYGHSMLIIEKLLLVAAKTSVLPQSQGVHL